MAGNNNNGSAESVEVEPPQIAISADTNITAPWPTFLLHALSADRGQALVWAFIGLVPALIAGAYIVLTMPNGQQFGLFALAAGYAVATMLAERNMTKLVVVVSKDENRICIDEQKWWRRDERAIPDAFKYANGKFAEAWLYRKDNHYEPWIAWRERLTVTAEAESAAHISSVKTTMGAAERMARHRQKDNREFARYGLLVLLALSGLIAVYLAGGDAIDTFAGTR